MAGEGFEVDEWDADFEDPDFVDQLVQAEELALSLSVSKATQLHHHPPPHLAAQQYANNNISYSPPRELSQRVHDIAAPAFGHDHCALAKEQEIERLKTELGRVSKQLSLLEEECAELKKERDKKQEQLKFVSSTTKAKDAEDYCRNSKNLPSGVSIHDDHGVPQRHQKGSSSNKLLGSRVNLCTSSSKGIGVQTDKAGESDNSSSKNDYSVALDHQKKLLGIWGPFDSQKFGRDLVLKLFATCEVDLQVLFGYLNLSLPSNSKVDSSQRKSDLPSFGHQKSADAGKVSHLYFTLTKISDEMLRWEDLVEALLELCCLENGVIVFRSLRVLHVVLKQAFGAKMTFAGRDNVLVMEPSYGHMSDISKHQSFDTGSQFVAHAEKTLDEEYFQHGEKLSHAKRNLFTPKHTMSISCIDLSSLFELMCQIMMRFLEEHVRMEAISIMNIVVISHNAYSEREKFASALVFQCISQLLRKEAGFPVRRQAIKLLYQLLNCPKITAAFCSVYEEGGESPVTTEVDTKINPTFKEFKTIMEGLADCVSCSENSANELKLRRSAITLVAFLASLGKTGFAILLNHRLSRRSNILVCVLQSLISDVNLEALDSALPPEVFIGRTLLLREALILLNRVVSHPQFSVPVLQALTSSREIASLTIDIAKRLSQKTKFIWQDESVTRQIRESEIEELARVFKRRVFTFLGDTTS